MEIAVESIASNLDLSGKRDQPIKHRSNGTSTLERKQSLPKMLSPTKSFELGRRIFLTGATLLCYFSMGYHSGILGPTLLHLQYVFETDTSGISKNYVFMNIGYVIGTVICAAVFDKINHELQFIFWGFIAALATFSLPWMPNLYYFYGCSMIQMIAHGVLYPCGQVYALKLWTGNSYQKPILQATHLMWSVGAFVSPFTTVPFLVDLDTVDTMENYNHTDAPTLNNNDTAMYINSNSESSYKHSLSDKGYNFDLSGIYRVRYIYAIAGVVDASSAVAFIFCFVLMGISCKPHKYFTITNVQTSKDNKDDVSRTDNTVDKIKPTLNKSLKIIMLIFLCVYLMFFFWYENGFGSYISIFSIKGLGWPIEKGAVLTSIFYGCHGLGRLTGVFISKCLQPAKIIMMNMFITTIAIACLLFAHVDDFVVLIATGITGFFVATTFPSIILWTAGYMSITGVLGGLFMGATSVGCMTAGPLIGYLFQNYTHMWVIYICLGSSVVCIGLFSVLLVIGCLVKKDNYDLEDRNVDHDGLVSGKPNKELSENI